MTTNGAQNKGRTYQRVPCMYCDKEIATNGMSSHYRNCVARKEFFATQRADRLKNAPIETLNLGEASEAGRMDEFSKALDSLSRL